MLTEVLTDLELADSRSKEQPNSIRIFVLKEAFRTNTNKVMKDIFIFCLLFALGLSSLSGKTHEELLAPYEARIWEGEESKRFLYRTASPDKVKKGKSTPCSFSFTEPVEEETITRDSYWMLEDWLPSKKKRSEAKGSPRFRRTGPQRLSLGRRWLEFARSQNAQGFGIDENGFRRIGCIHCRG